MKHQTLLSLAVGAGFLMAGPLLSKAEARDRHDNHHRHRSHHYNHYYHGPSSGIIFDFNLSPAPVYRPAPASYAYSRNLVADVQRALNRRGYPAGYVDGVMGGQTRAAIRDYQDDRGLRVTGTINDSLLRSLGL